MERDWRDDRIEELERALEARDRLIARLEKRNTELEEGKRLSSSNSSMPPSTDRGDARKKRRRKKPSGRKPGAQKGHKKHERALEPVEKVDNLTDSKPTHCECCGQDLEGEDPSPRRHQWYELPPVKPILNEVQVHTLECPRCQHMTRGQLPQGVPTRAFGPTVDATIGLLIGVCRLSKRAVSELMGQLFGLSMSVGAVVGCQKAVDGAIEEPVDEAGQFVKLQGVKYADETSWQQARARAWLWTVVTSLVTVFMIHGRRNAEAARELLGQAHGVLCTDRHRAYDWWPQRLRQSCWAHLIRHFVAIEERGGQSGRIGQALHEEANRMFHWWHQVRDGTLARSTFQAKMRLVKKRVHELLLEGRELDDGDGEKKTAGTCKRVLESFDTLWTFVRLEGVEPTNNTGERSIRHGVIWRKISYGTHSEWGSRFVARILTVHATLKQQDRNILEFLRDACESKLHNRPGPSLLPLRDASVEPRREAA